MPPSGHGHFHPILILPVKMVELPQQYANTTYGPSVVNFAVTSCCKKFHFKLGRVPGSASCENESFFILIQNVATFIESHFVFLCYFLQYDEVFLINLLDGCYHYLVFADPINGCSKSKLLVRVNFIKK